MVSPINFIQSSLDNTTPIASSSVNFVELLVTVVQKTSQLGGSLDKKDSAFTFSYKVLALWGELCQHLIEYQDEEDKTTNMMVWHSQSSSLMNVIF